MSTTFVTYHWAEPDPEIVAQQLISLAAELEDLAEPMALAGSITRTDILSNFASESDPSGAAWQEWAESYEPWALTHGSGKILNLDGHLVGAMGDPSAYVPTNEGLFLDTSGLPEYWAWNNFGAERRSADTETRASNEFTRAASKGKVPFGAFPGENVLPERPFVGLSIPAREKIDRVFALWFNGEVSIAMSGRGSKLRGPGGRFVKMS